MRTDPSWWTVTPSKSSDVNRNTSSLGARHSMLGLGWPSAIHCKWFHEDILSIQKIFQYPVVFKETFSSEPWTVFCRKKNKNILFINFSLRWNRYLRSRLFPESTVKLFEIPVMVGAWHFLRSLVLIFVMSFLLSSQTKVPLPRKIAEWNRLLYWSSPKKLVMVSWRELRKYLQKIECVVSQFFL